MGILLNPAYVKATPHMIQPIRSSEIQNFTVGLIILLVGLVSVWIFPTPDVAKGLSSYVPLHTVMEVLAVSVAAMVFGISWATHRLRPNSRALVLGVSFLGVALLDLSHTLSYAGMPDFVTPSSPEKAINFWLAARLLAALAFVWVAFWPTHLASWIARRSQYWTLAIVLVIVGVIHYVFLFHPAIIPRTFIEGQGLTPFKITFEYGLIVIYLVAGFGFFKRWRKKREVSDSILAMSALTMAMSEFFFTLYANVTDIYNVAGHIYKIIAFAFLYRALFVETIRHPYESLEKSEAQYLATLDTLPDLLFEVDKNGVYLSVHAWTERMLAVPAAELIGSRLDEVLPEEAAAICYRALEEADKNTISRGHRIKINTPEGQQYFELSVAKKLSLDEQDSTFLILSRNATESVLHENQVAFETAVNTTLLDLQEREDLEQESDFLLRWLAFTKALTNSSTGFVFAVHENQQNLNLLACLSNAVSLAPEIPNTNIVTLSDAGRWADTLRTNKPVMINTALSAEDSRGLPEAQEELKNLLVISVHEGKQVKLIVGVSNKPEPYTEQESKALQVMAATLWNLLKQGRKDAVINQLSEALEQSPHSIVITDTSARIQYVNRAFCEASGYRAEEAIGQNPKILKSGETSPGLYEELWKHLTQGRSWQGEFINKKKNGEIYIELVSVYPIRDRFGKLTHYVAHKVDVTEHKASEKRIRDLSEFDALTGLLNRNAFQEKLTTAIEDSAKNKRPLCLLWFNLDNFKSINDTLGHAVGDEMLIEMANRIAHGLGNNATVGRHGGDSFVAIIPKERQSIVALKVREVLDQLQTPLTINAQPLSVSASAGVAVYPEDAQTAGALASAAEIAMYRAKQEGRNGLRFFAPEMQEYTQRSLDLAVSLKGAQTRGELFLVFQPQLRLKDQKIIGAEVLLRWQHPTLGLIAPSEFIPIAEQTGMIVPIGRWVMEQAAQHLKRWSHAGMPDLFLAVNVSAIQFVQPGFVEDLMEIMAHANIPTHRIEIEITEAVALKNAEQADAIIHRLHTAGFAVALDDFGTGYSSLSYLKRYAIDRLKIDQSFVRDLAKNQSDQAIVNAIVHMARSLNMSTIAEGVETAEQAEILKMLGCDEIQGHWFSKPLIEGDLTALLSS